jgi:hypothetical protein
VIEVAGQFEHVDRTMDLPQGRVARRRLRWLRSGACAHPACIDPARFPSGSRPTALRWAPPVRPCEGDGEFLKFPISLGGKSKCLRRDWSLVRNNGFFRNISASRKVFSKCSVEFRFANEQREEVSKTFIGYPWNILDGVSAHFSIFRFGFREPLLLALAREESAWVPLHFGESSRSSLAFLCVEW